MQNSLQNGTVLVGRILLGLLFVLSGFGKIDGFAGTAGYIASKGLPMPELLAALTIVAELVGGLALVVGAFTRQAALALAGFTLLAAFVFHAFWAAPQASAVMEQISFMKNLAIAGGLLVLAAFGPGSMSVGRRFGRA